MYKINSRGPRAETWKIQRIQERKEEKLLLLLQFIRKERDDTYDYTSLKQIPECQTKMTDE